MKTLSEKHFHTNFALNSLTNVLKSCIIEYRIRKHSLSHSDVCGICVIVRKVCLVNKPYEWVRFIISVIIS